MDAIIRHRVRDEFRVWKKTVVDFNRFDTKNELLKLLLKSKDEILYKISEGYIVYRGRNLDLYDKLLDERQMIDFLDEKTIGFDGYDAIMSGAPSKENACNGRANCEGISVLYTCNDVNTVFYELRPQINECISIAKFVTTKQLEFADLRKNSIQKLQANDELYQLLLYISVEMSKPNYGGDNYIFTQYLVGHLINMGFDGMIFTSSLCPTGDNLVFFEPDDCVAKNSHLYMVDDIKINYRPVTRETVFDFYSH